MNDYSMFKEFPCSFAMDNAVQEIKKAATYITASNIGILLFILKLKISVRKKLKIEE